MSCSVGSNIYPGLSKRVYVTSSVVAALALASIIVLTVVRYVHEYDEPSTLFRTEIPEEFPCPAVVVCPFNVKRGDRILEFYKIAAELNFTEIYRSFQPYSGHYFGLVADDPRILVFDSDLDNMRFAPVTFNRTVGTFKGCMVFNEDLSVKFKSTTNIMYMFILHQYGFEPTPYPLLIMGLLYPKGPKLGRISLVDPNRGVIFDTHSVDLSKEDLSPFYAITSQQNILASANVGKVISLNGEVKKNLFSLDIVNMPSIQDALYDVYNKTRYNDTSFIAYGKWRKIAEEHKIRVTTLSIMSPTFVINVNEEVITYTIWDVVATIGGAWSLISLYFSSAFPIDAYAYVCLDVIPRKKRRLKFTKGMDPVVVKDLAKPLYDHEASEL